jgi:glycosyltransferase involved in cell wall biosynthesis
LTPERLLMIVPVMPSDRGNGLAMRAGFFLDAYARRFAVDLVVVPVAGAVQASAFVQARARRIEILDPGRLDSHYALVASVRDPVARLEAFRRYGRPSLTAFIGLLRPALDALAAGTRYDTVHVFRLYLAELAAPWIERRPDRLRMVLDCDEDDALAYRRLAAMERRRHAPGAAAWAIAEAEAFARLATAWLPKFDRIVAASDREARSLAAFDVRTAVIPNTVARPPSRPARRRGRCYAIVFVGTLGYPPNADAVIWFVSRVWPRLARALGDRVRFTVVGGNPPPEVARLASQRGIEVTGAVADVASYYRDADLAVAPIRGGGGTRIKVIEAAAYGVPVVATGFAAEGTTFQHGVDMLMANDEASFLRACLVLARDRSLSARLAARARTKAMRDYSPGVWRTRAADLVAQD